MYGFHGSAMGYLTTIPAFKMCANGSRGLQSNMSNPLMAGQPTPPTSPRNKALWSGLIEHRFPLIRAVFLKGKVKGGRFTSHENRGKSGQQKSKKNILQQEQALFPSANLKFWKKHVIQKEEYGWAIPPPHQQSPPTICLLRDSNLNLHLLPLMGRGNNPKFRLPHLTKFQQVSIFRPPPKKKLPTSMKTIMNGFQARCIYVYIYIYIHISIWAITPTV